MYTLYTLFTMQMKAGNLIVLGMSKGEMDIVLISCIPPFFVHIKLHYYCQIFDFVR